MTLIPQHFRLQGALVLPLESPNPLIRQTKYTLRPPQRLSKTLYFLPQKEGVFRWFIGLLEPVRSSRRTREASEQLGTWGRAY